MEADRAVIAAKLFEIWQRHLRKPDPGNGNSFGGIDEEEQQRREAELGTQISIVLSSAANSYHGFRRPVYVDAPDKTMAGS